MHAQLYSSCGTSASAVAFCLLIPASSSPQFLRERERERERGRERVSVVGMRFPATNNPPPLSLPLASPEISRQAG